MQATAIRRAALPDIPAISAIYNDAILRTTATFDTEPKTDSEQLAWFQAHDERHPILVAVLGGRVVGWASLSRWSDRCAYSETAEVSAYVDANLRGRGVGRQLMEALEGEAQRAGLHTFIARIVEGNEASIRLCASFGFRRVGVMKEVGLKFGRRLDVIIMQKVFGRETAPLVEPSTSVLRSVCDLLTEGSIEEARAVARRALPFRPAKAAGRSYSAEDALRVFVRDGFVDRYSGRRLVLPGALRLLSALLPEEFPFHPNWKTTECHDMYWHLSPTVDHVVPIARGGADREENWVTTSMIRNEVKGLWSLEELGWALLPPGDMATWDGLLGWFVEFVDRNPGHLSDGIIGRWHRAAVARR